MTEENKKNLKQTIKTPELLEAHQALTTHPDYQNSEWTDTQVIDIIKNGNLLQLRAIERIQNIEDIHDNYGNTLMHFAAKYGTPEIIDELAQHGYDLNQANTAGEKPIHIATRVANMANVEHLCEKGVSINEPNSISLKTPLHIAAVYLDIENLRQLVLSGADVNAKNKWGQTPLFSAVANHKIENVMELLQMGSDINERDQFGNTPLFYSALLGDMKMVELLCSRGANINITNNKGFSAEALATEEKHIDVVHLLHTFSLKKFLDNRITQIDHKLAELKELTADTLSEKVPGETNPQQIADIRYSRFRAMKRLSDVARYTRAVGMIARQNEQRNKTTSFSQLQEALRLSLTNASPSKTFTPITNVQQTDEKQSFTAYLDSMQELLNTVKTNLKYIPDSVLSSAMGLQCNYAVYSLSRAYARLNELCRYMGKSPQQNISQIMNTPTVQSVTSAREMIFSHIQKGIKENQK